MDSQEKSDELTKTLNKFIDEISESVIYQAILQEKKYRQMWGPAAFQTPNKDGTITGRPSISLIKGKDIYGQEKPVEVKYFTCTLCDRQVAGSRFAAHVAKCITRGRRPRTGYS